MFSLDRYEVAVLLAHGRHLGVGREPGEGEAPEHRLHRLPAGLLHPPRLLLLQRLYPRLVVPDGGHLGPEHDRGEQTEEQTLQWRKVGNIGIGLKLTVSSDRELRISPQTAERE